jgi:glycerophosphoryl diester phosphodiesterase
MTPISRPLLLGHRGLRVRGLRWLNSTMPSENSLAAFEYAMSQGCDGFEFDVRPTRDGRNALWHDPDFNGREIAATDFAQLTNRDGTRLVCLEDVLAQFGHRAYLDIEIKVTGHEESVVAALWRQRPERPHMVSSFLPEVLLRLHDIDDQIPLGYICERADLMARWRELPIKVFLPRRDLVWPQLIGEVHGRGDQIMTWTVNSASQMLQLADSGVDGLISDDPALLHRTFHRE